MSWYSFFSFIFSFLTMGAAQSTTREEDFLIEKDFFRRNAFLVISEMVGMLRDNNYHHSELVDEILHCIFFLGVITDPRYTPEYIVSDEDMLNVLKGRFPQPFKRYSTELPRRSPISCVLDMIVYMIGQENEDEIIKWLQKLIFQLKEGNAKELVCSTICVSQRDKTAKSVRYYLQPKEGNVKELVCSTTCVSQCDNTPQSVRYYGVSMSTSGRNPGQIVVAASCLSIWDSYVADAVMTYYPTKEKKKYFDGTIKLPKQVRCEAFNISDGKEKPPCRSCGNLFGLTTTETQQWPYGNCAEPESLSNLFKKEKDVREQARPTSPTWTDSNRAEAKEAVMKKLRCCLKNAKFNWDNNFYTPQAIQPSTSNCDIM